MNSVKEIPEKSEGKIQQLIYIWYNNNFCLSHHNPRQIIFPCPNQNHHGLSLIGGIKAGVADLVVIHNGRPYMVEVKIPGGAVRKSQKMFRVHCEQSGIPYYIVDNLQQFQALVKQWDHPTQDRLF